MWAPPNTHASVLPTFLDVEIKSSHVERVAHRLSGGARLSGLSTSALQDMLLKFGNHSADLREAHAALSRRLSNYIVPWDEIKALKAKRFVGLNKYPGIRPIGIGHVNMEIDLWGKSWPI